MGVPDVLVDRDVVDAVGEEAIRVACAQLWPEDCVICGSSLGDGPPSLWVRPASPGYAVALCHSGCGPPSGGAPATPPGTSWRLRSVVAPVSADSELPILVLNPGAERVYLASEGRQWRVRFGAEFPGVTFARFVRGFELDPDRPLPGATLRLTPDAVEVDLRTETYRAIVHRRFVGPLRRCGGCLLVVTHAVWALDGLTWADIVAVMERGDAVGGWLGLAGAPGTVRQALDEIGRAVAQAVEPPVAVRGPLLLRFDEWDRAVLGVVASLPGRAPVGSAPVGSAPVGSAPDGSTPDCSTPDGSVSDHEAVREWAERHLPERSRLLPWQPVSGGGAATAWRTQDAVTLTCYELVVDGSGTRLLRELAAGQQPDHATEDVTTEDGTAEQETFAWAATVLGAPVTWTETATVGSTRWFTTGDGTAGVADGRP